MKHDAEFHTRAAIRFASLVLLIAVLAESALGQQKPLTTPKEDVLRIDTALVQTQVSVTDKKGQFVDGLRREQFELRVDGKLMPFSFFERVTAGSLRERELATQPNVPVAAADDSGPAPTVLGRTIIFFIDDLHLSPESLNRTRETLLHFVNYEMGSKDLVAIGSASGQIGFLQQFTDNREVLTAAVERLVPRPYVVLSYGTGSTSMSEYAALTIEQKADDQVLRFYVEECMRQASSPRMSAAYKMLLVTCQTEVKESARAVLMQAANITANSLVSLESVMRSAVRLPGRKLAFFISDGFLLDTGARTASLRERLEQIIDTAQRAGVVVYTIHARGLVSSALDATTNGPHDGQGRLESVNLREIAATQDALNALAVDTGGRALRNQNTFDAWVTRVLDETSNYYLVAWRPETEIQKEKKFRDVVITIADRPDLSVRVPRGYLQGFAPTLPTTVASLPLPGKASPAVGKTRDADLREALTDSLSSGSLPTLLSLTYLNTPANGMVLTSSVQIAGKALNFGAGNREAAAVEFAGVILNDRGKIAGSFKNRLTVNPVSAVDPSSAERADVIYNHRTPLLPGIYQVRVAARDERSGRVGSAQQWLVIPDLSRNRLTLSSLLLGGRVLDNGKRQDAEALVQISVDRRFSRMSHLGFWFFIYNAAKDQVGAVNLAVQAEVLRDGRRVLLAPESKLPVQNQDPVRIPFGGELALKSLTPGRYNLRLTVKDGIAGKDASQNIDFDVQ